MPSPLFLNMGLAHFEPNLGSADSAHLILVL